MASHSDEATRILDEVNRGSPSAVNRLFPLVYEELRALAHQHLKRERAGQTLQTTALAHEAYLRLINQENVDWSSRTHFRAIAAEAIRRILVDHARSRHRIKRGGGWRRLTLEEVQSAYEDPGEDLLALDEALERLATLEKRHRDVVVLRFFGGLTIEEVAHALGISPRTVNDDWKAARAWLHRELCGDV